MGREVNVDSIRDLEERIEEHEMAIITLKRARNSLLNVSTLPPEILGKIFRWNVTLEGNFRGLEDCSCNFLFVCHYWFEVASQTPELWTFWGNNTRDWDQRYLRSNVMIPLDLVLNGMKHTCDVISEHQQTVLKERAACDTIRRIHLWSDTHHHLTSIISPLISPSGGLPTNSLESLILRSEDITPLDVSFLAHSYLPKLQYLDLFDCTTSSWGHLASQTTLLTTLDLSFNEASPALTMHQLLSTLASNPHLRELGLATRAIPDDDGDDDRLYQVSLHHLLCLRLDGGVGQVFRLLHRLEFPQEMDMLHLCLSRTQVIDISQKIGPYLQDYLQRRGKSRDGLGVSVSSIGRITFELGDPWRLSLSPSFPSRMEVFALFDIRLDQAPADLLDRSILDLIAYIPRGDVAYLRTSGCLEVVRDLRVQLPSLKTLDLLQLPLSAVFPAPDQDQPDIQKSFPSSLQHILLEQPFVNGFDWESFITFLAYRVASRNPLNSLLIDGCCHICHRMVHRINDLVLEWEITDRCRESWCPFDVCR